jgi:hypothetical protein
MNPQPAILGESETVDFPELELMDVPARIDTGARTSTVWASRVLEKDGGIEVTLFGPGSEFYTGKVLRYEEFETRVVTSSNGISEERYMAKILIHIGGRKIRARFTFADRSKQTYPVLIGRNVLRGKFVVDVKHNRVKVKTVPRKVRKLTES